MWCWQDKGEKKENGKHWDYQQKLAFRAEYSEFFDLRVVPYTYNSLCFAVTHKLHGHAMRTGWKRDATSLADRSTESSEQNMLLETQFSNCLKSNFETKTYPDLKQAVRDVTVDSMGPKDQHTGLGMWFDTNETQITEFPDGDELIDNLLDIDEDDGFGFEDAVVDPSALAGFAAADDLDNVDDMQTEDEGVQVDRQCSSEDELVVESLFLEGEDRNEGPVDGEAAGKVTALWHEYERIYRLVQDRYPKHYSVRLVRSLLEHITHAALTGNEKELSRIRDERLLPRLEQPVDMDSHQQEIAALTADYHVSFDFFCGSFGQRFHTTEVRMRLEVMQDAARDEDRQIFEETKRELSSMI